MSVEKRPALKTDESPVASPLLTLFQEKKAIARDCLILIYDLENFTTFLTIPDIHRSVAKYVNFVDQQIRFLFEGGHTIGFQTGAKIDGLPLTILQQKFLGDGVMYIASFDSDDEDERSKNARALCMRAIYFGNNFARLNEQALAFMPVSDMPKSIRFGITYGTVLEMARTDEGREYIGFPINLAARLQKYAGKAGFLASARLPGIDSWAAKFNLVKARAKALRGRSEELIFMEDKKQDTLVASGEYAEFFDKVGANVEAKK